MRRISRLTTAAMLIIASATATAQDPPPGVRGIQATSAPGSVTLEWQDVADPDGIAEYIVAYAHTSIVESGGIVEDAEGTGGPGTSFTIHDLAERGFLEGEMMFLSVAAVDTLGIQSPFEEEASVIVSLAPGSPSGPTTGDAVPAPRLTHAVAVNATTVQLFFSEQIQIVEGGQITIWDEESGSPLLVTSVTDAGDHLAVTTAPQAPLRQYTVRAEGAVTSLASSPLDPQHASATFVGREGEPAPAVVPTSALPAAPPPTPVDTTPPEDPAGLTLAKAVTGENRYTVKVSWQQSPDTARDLFGYGIYESTNRGSTYLGPITVAATVLSATLTDVPAGTLTVKVTARDASGNESPGIDRTIVLPETGPGLALILSAAGAGIGAVVRRRRRR